MSKQINKQMPTCLTEDSRSHYPILHCEPIKTCLLIIAFLIVLHSSTQPVLAVNSPTVSPSTGSFMTPQFVTMSAPSGKIYYSIDGSVPTTQSLLYSSPIVISGPTQINAVTYQSGVYSPITTVYLDVDSALGPVLQSLLFLRLRSNFGLVTSTGSPSYVNAWTDLSGSGNTAVSTPGNQPTFVPGASGISGVNFNGNAQFLCLPSNSSIFSLGATFFLVVKPTSPSSGACFFDLGNGIASNNIYMSEPSTNGADLHVVAGSTDSSVSSSTAITTDQYQLLEASYNGSNTAAIFTNGIEDAQSTSMQTVNLITRSSNFIGKAGGGSNYYSGNIAEILMYCPQLTTSQQAAVEGYLMQKYQLLSLTPRTPIISVAGGTLTGPTQVAIASQLGTITYVTTDGTLPSTSSPIYSGPINVYYSQTVKAISVANGLSSTVTSAAYTLNSSQWPAPNPGDITAPTINLQLPAPSI